MNKTKNFLLIIVAFFAGSVISLSTAMVFAHGGDTSMIHGCVRNNAIGNLANIRIVSATTNCNSNETALDWNIQGVPGPTGMPGPTGIPGQTASSSAYFGLPFFCTLHDLTPFASNFKGNDFSSAQLNKCGFDSVDLTGVIFKKAYFSSSSISNSNLTNANFSTSKLEQAIFNNSDLQNVNFSGANLESVKFTGAQHMDTANLTGVTWSNVTCPDGTNSDDNGNTCIGHLTP